MCFVDDIGNYLTLILKSTVGDGLMEYFNTNMIVRAGGTLKCHWSIKNFFHCTKENSAKTNFTFSSPDVDHGELLPKSHALFSSSSLALSSHWSREVGKDGSSLSLLEMRNQLTTAVQRRHFSSRGTSSNSATTRRAHQVSGLLFAQTFENIIEDCGTAINLPEDAYIILT
ncbi:hypothetical protein NPIL_677021 [Nephila pilipes]|uniref:Uncharacterized protein n=1 Tax=Nephila pilipes TaxID=299642 RepID=A0A8X6TDC2_NEPPI|nr:hypothetical protein NPIL_259081 [Nephila pilipes]GFS98102.1 hypothetical protein NPIL_677021 [Nephila pilipes]